MRKLLLIEAVALAVLAAGCSGGGSKPAMPATGTALASPGTATTTLPSASPSASAAASESPSMSEIHAIALTEGPPIPLLEGRVLYYYAGKVPIEGQPQVLLRALQSVSGRTIDDLTARIPHATSLLFNMVSDPVRGRLAIRICLSGRCDLLGPPDPDSRSTAFRSDDGGISWHEMSPLAASTLLLGFTAEGRLVATQPNGSDKPRYFFVDDNADIAPPVAGWPSRGGAVGAGTISWMRADGTLFDLSGVVIGGPVQLPAGGKFSVTSRSLVDAVVWMPLPRDSDGSGYISELAPDGKLGRTVSWKGFDMDVVARIDADRLLTIRYFAAPGSIGQAFIVDMRDGSFRKISGLREEANGDTYPIALLVGPFARVVSGADCLNVREKPAQTSLSLGCFKDGVLLRLRAQSEQTADGSTWIAVETPDGRAGWASAEFLER